MKVLIVDQYAKTTGDETAALATLLDAEEDISVQIYLSNNSKYIDPEKYPVKVIKGFAGAYEGTFVNKAVNYLKGLRQLKKYIREYDPDVVHLQWFSLPWLEWIFTKWVAKKYKLVITIHDVIPFDRRPFEMKALNQIYKTANHLCLHTEFSRDTFKKNYSAKTPVSVITQAFCQKQDFEVFDKETAKKHFNISKDAVVFLFFGTIRKSKGLDYLIRAIHTAYEKNKNVFLLIAGAFQHVDEQEYKDLLREQLSPENSLVNWGFVPQEDEKWYFNAADVLCLPYLEITQSGVAQRGLMYELPTIASDIGAMSEVIRQGYNGVLVAPENVETLSEAIVELASDKKTRKLFSENAKRMAEEEFSLNIKADIIANIYREVEQI